MQLNTSNVSLSQARKLSDSNKPTTTATTTTTTTSNTVSTASTIPIQSPHSPLHICVPPQKAHNRLSARYINNKPLTTTTTTATKSNNMETNTPNNSKLLCSCEKKQTTHSSESTPPSSADSMKCQTVINPATKRIITTRNASTSPNLDMRRIDAKIIYSNGYNTKQTHEKATDTNEAGLMIYNKMSLEKSNSLTDAKPQKLLRTTRSMSPRPPVRHQQAIIIADEQKLDMATMILNSNSKLSNTSNNNHYMQVKAYCHSEQTSPNTPDISGILFHYNEKATNKSAECLPKVNTDPWLHINEVNRRNLSSESLRDKCAQDPWIKRIEAKQQFRQTKSFSGIRSDLDVIGNKRPPLTRNKSPTFQDFRLPANLPLQSAPSSPNFLSVNNSFSLGFPLGGSLTSSPIKTKQYTQQESVHNGRQTSNQKVDGSPIYLNINQSHSQHLLQACHSCSSLTPNCNETELPLNIRRLSQQMRKEEQTKPRLKDNNVSCLSTSEQNVKQPLNVSLMQFYKGGADFSEYLQQHLQSGRKISPMARDKGLMQAKLEVLAKNAHDDALLETTC